MLDDDSMMGPVVECRKMAEQSDDRKQREASGQSDDHGSRSRWW